MSKKKPVKSKMVRAVVTGDEYEDAKLPTKPSEKHTVLVKCQEPGCHGLRWCKPQDAWQVKRCVACQTKKKKTKMMERLPVVIAKAKAKEKIEKEAFYRPRPFVYHVPWDRDTGPKLPTFTRVWPN